MTWFWQKVWLGARIGWYDALARGPGIYSPIFRARADQLREEAKNLRRLGQTDGR